MSDNKNLRDLSPDEEQLIAREEVQEPLDFFEVEKLKNIVETLKNPEASFLDAFKEVQRILKLDDLSLEQLVVIENRVLAIVMRALKENKIKIIDKIGTTLDSKLKLALKSLLEIIENPPSHILERLAANRKSLLAESEKDNNKGEERGVSKKELKKIAKKAAKKEAKKELRKQKANAETTAHAGVHVQVNPVFNVGAAGMNGGFAVQNGGAPTGRVAPSGDPREEDARLAVDRTARSGSARQGQAAGSRAPNTVIDADFEEDPNTTTRTVPLRQVVITPPAGDKGEEPKSVDGSDKAADKPDSKAGVDSVPDAVKTPDAAPEKTSTSTDIVSIDQIKTADDLVKLAKYFGEVVTRFGDKPGENDTQLFWKVAKPGKTTKLLDIEEVNNYRRFLALSEKGTAAIVKYLNHDLVTIIPRLEEMIRNGKKDDVILQSRVEAERMLSELLDKVSVGVTVGGVNVIKGGHDDEKLFLPAAAKRVLLLKALGVPKDISDDEAERYAFMKIVNVLRVATVSDDRREKMVYRLAIDENGKRRGVMPLAAYLDSPEVNGRANKIVKQSHQALVHLYEMFGAERKLSFSEFRDCLIDIIRFRGGGAKELRGKIDNDIAKEIYMSFLTILDPLVHEKEVLAMLLSYKEVPPEVYELYGGQFGWEVLNKDNPKTGNDAYQDFCRDGVMYAELKDYFKDQLKLDESKFNNFIIETAQRFKILTSALQVPGEIDYKKIAEQFEMNSENVKVFESMLKLPLFLVKIEGAFKYAIADQKNFFSRVIPRIDLIEGADAKKPEPKPEKVKLDVMLVDVAEKIKKVAHRLAVEKLDKELKEAGPQGFFKKFWKVLGKWYKRNAYQAYLEQYEKEFVGQLKSNPQLLAQYEKDFAAPVERFGMAEATGDHDSWLVDEEKASIAPLSLEHNPEAQAIHAALQKLFKDYLEGHCDDDDFKVEMKRICAMVKSADNDHPQIMAFLEESGANVGEGAGLLDKLRKLKAHQAGVAALDIGTIQINLGTAKNVDAKTVIKDMSFVDRKTGEWMKKLQKSRLFGRLFSPPIASIIAYGVTNIGSQLLTSKAVRYASFALVPFGGWPFVMGLGASAVVGGLATGMRKNVEVQRSRAQKEVREELNDHHDDDKLGFRPNQAHDKRFEHRLKKSGALYEKANGQDLIDRMDAGEQWALVEAIARDELAHEIKGGLITWSDKDNSDVSRTKLRKAIHELKLKLLNSGAADWVNHDLTSAVAERKQAILKDVVEVADAKAKSFKRKEVAKAAGIGMLVGAGSSAAVSGVSSLVGHFAGWTDGIGQPSGPQVINEVPVIKSVDLLEGRSAVGETELRKILAAKLPGFDDSKLIFERGQLNAKSVEYLQDNFGVTLKPTEVSVIGTVPGPTLDPVAALKADGFERITKHHIHFNDNEMLPGHADDNHLRDELLVSAPKVGANGNYDVSIAGMKDPAKLRSMLTPGVNFPWNTAEGSVDLTQYKVGYQIKIDGKNLWKFAPIDANGHFQIPKEYIDATKFDGKLTDGKLLHGLKTDGLAIAFQDEKTKTWEVLASIQGEGGFKASVPPVPVQSSEFNYSATQLEKGTEAAQEVADEKSAGAVIIPGVPASPMGNFEHGKDEQVRMREIMEKVQHNALVLGLTSEQAKTITKRLWELDGLKGLSGDDLNKKIKLEVKAYFDSIPKKS